MQLNNVSLIIDQTTILQPLNWQCVPGQTWAVLGGNASGKSSLAKLITGELCPTGGCIEQRPNNVVCLSLEAQQALYERELYRDDTDFMDQLDEGTSVRELLCEISPWSLQHEQLVSSLQLSKFVDRGYRLLSSGEGRRVMLARALLAQPELLILDEPFEGLDIASCTSLHEALNNLVDNGQWLMLVVNQQSDIIERCSHLALLDQGELLFSGAMPSDLNDQWQALLQKRQQVTELPAREPAFQLADWPVDKPLIELENGFIQYDECYQFQHLHWQLLPGQHTHIQGPNGCGKSTLLGLITGDHPQCYRNNLKVFGYQRGQGESIWQIKKHLGYVSGALHRDYRISGNVLTVVISGLTDSIGLYQKVGQHEKELALAWLKLIALDSKANQSFKQLSMGEQRLVLILRALIKQPPLLILDEPTQGLDDFNRFYVLRMVESIIEHGPTTLLFVSHRQDEQLACLKHKLSFEPSTQADTLYDISSRFGVRATQAKQIALSGSP